MASNTELDSTSGGDKIVTKERTHDGDPAKQQMMGVSGVSGTEGAYTFVDVQAGAGTAANALRTTLASNDPAVIALQLLDNAISGAGYNITQLGGVNVNMGEGVIATGTQRVSLATDDDAVSSLAAIEAAVGGTHIDDATYTLGSSDGVPFFGFAGTQTITAGRVGVLACTTGGYLKVDSASVPGSATSAATAFDSYIQVAVNLTTGANQVLVSSAPNKQIWVYGYALVCGTANGQTISLQDEDDAALTGIMAFAQYGGMVAAPSGNFEMPAFKLGTDKDLEIDITGGDVDGWLSYALVSV